MCAVSFQLIGCPANFFACTVRLLRENQHEEMYGDFGFLSSFSNSSS
jgi:hypothetical protein